MAADPLELELSSTLSRNAKYAIVTKLWGYPSSLEEFIDNESRFTAYLTYYENECRQTKIGTRSTSLPFHTHRQVLDAICTIYTARIRPFDELRELLEEKYPAFQKAIRNDQNLGVTLCLRLWLMMNIRDPIDENYVAGAGTIEWNEKLPVMTFVQKALRGTNIPLRGSGDSATCTTLEFKARNLDRLAGISILFTANLADHLVYDHDNNRLLIYHFNSFLTEHLTPSSRNSVFLDVFDETFLRETQQTLSLIFPCWDADTTAYLNQLKKGNNIDVDSLLGNVTLMPRRFYSSDFEFYGVRLEDLRDALNSKQPFSIRQLWFDRRNRQAWCTLWVAVVVFILTIIFGVISSVTSIMQVKIALKMADGQGH